MTDKEIQIIIGFEQRPSENVNIPELSHGGLRVDIGDVTLTRWRGEEAQGKNQGGQPRYDSEGNYLDAGFYGFKGEFIASTIHILVKTLTGIIKEEGRFSEQHVDLVGSGDGQLIISYLDGKHVRLAYHGEYGNEDSRYYPPIESLLGYAVDLNDFSLEVIEVAEEYLTFAENAEVIGSTLDGIEENLGMLKELVNS